MHDNDLTIIGQRIAYSDTRAEVFGLTRADRRHHLYAQGKTGSGKSTLLLRMLIQDLHRGEGVCLIDPIGNTAEKLLSYIPRHRTEQVRYFNVTDLERPLGLNVLAGVDADHRHRAVTAGVDVFTSICDLSIARTPQLLDVLSYGLAALAELPEATLLHLPRLLTDDGYRVRMVERLSDPGVRSHWKGDFGRRSARERRDMCGSVLNKVGELRRNPLMRNIFGQTRNAVDAAALLRQRGILIVNLAKAEITRENARLIGAFIISQLILAATARMAAIARLEQENPIACAAAFPDFYLYIEEFQDMATAKFDEALSQSRGGRLSLSLFNQYQSQLSEQVQSAVFGNVGSLITFGVGAEDAKSLAENLSP